MSDPSKALSEVSFRDLCRSRGPREVWIDEASTASWTRLGEAFEHACQECARREVQVGDVVALSTSGGLDFLAWLFALSTRDAIIAPLRAEQIGARLLEPYVPVRWRVEQGGIAPLDLGTMAPQSEILIRELAGRGHPGLILATGGTTGAPKLVLHDLKSIWASMPVKEGRPWRVLPLMRFDHIGGLDMAWRALAGGQVIVAPPAEVTPHAVAATIARHRVEVLPATPSFLNLLLMADLQNSRDLSSLRIIPYGAEPMPAPLLGRLRAAFPHVDFVQRFGTSETGTLPVRDEGDGLVLSPHDANYSWKVVDGELWVRSPSRALGYLSGDGSRFEAGGWFQTGDLAEVLPNGSLKIRGRRAEFINVGGEKVIPEEVEAALLRHPLVADCHVMPAPNAVLGQVVAAEVVWLGPEQKALAVKRLLHQFASTLIARHKLPAVVRLVASVQSTATLKKPRGAAR